MPSFKNAYDGNLKSTIEYDKENAWEVYETAFEKDCQGKCEAVLSLGNGYMGVRSALEESYTGQTRNMFIAGTFNRFDENEVTELPNAADMTAIEIRIDGEQFSLETGETLNYKRWLNFKKALLKRNVTWKSSKNTTVDMEFERFVSLANLHTIGQKLTITPDKDTKILVKTGIDGSLTNTGTQHFSEGEKRF